MDASSHVPPPSSERECIGEYGKHMWQSRPLRLFREEGWGGVDRDYDNRLIHNYQLNLGHSSLGSKWVRAQDFFLKNPLEGIWGHVQVKSDGGVIGK